MSTQENKAMVQRFVDEFWNKGNPGVIDELFAEGWVWHSSPAGMPANRDGLRLMSSMRGAFSDAQTVIENQVAEGDQVATQWSFRGLNSGSLMGIPPTNKQITFGGISIDRIEDGKFVERWDVADMAGLMQQLGGIPT